MAELAARGRLTRVEAVFVPAPGDRRCARSGALGRRAVPRARPPGVLERVATTVTPQPAAGRVGTAHAARRGAAGRGVRRGRRRPGRPGQRRAPCCARPRPPAPTAWSSPRARSTSTTPSACGPRPGRCSTCPLVDHVELGELRWRSGCAVLGTSARGGTPYTSADLTGRWRWCSATRPTACRPALRSTSGHHPPRRPGREPERGHGRRRRLLRGRPPTPLSAWRRDPSPCRDRARLPRRRRLSLRADRASRHALASISAPPGRPGGSAPVRLTAATLRSGPGEPSPSARSEGPTRAIHPC